MGTFFPVTKSTLSATALADTISAHYPVGRIQQCIFYSAGINDTYQLTTARGEVYFLRVYRTPWRSFEEVAYEIDALNHLHRKGFPAAHPVTGRNGRDIHHVIAPEGERCLVLFTLAPGKPPTYDEDGEAKASEYGRAVARMHNALQDFKSSYQRSHIDLDHLIFTPLKNIKPYLQHDPTTWDYLTGFVDRLVDRIQALPFEDLEWGFCHGNLQGHHHHTTQDGTMTFFDFDCCGYGIRAYDLAVFHWCFHQEKNETEMWTAYLQGYQQERRLNEVDRKAISLFICARYIWHMGLHTGNAADWGCDWLDDGYFDKAVKNLQACEKDFSEVKSH
jgi:Ser/Thr protein kinase RdoA (MazF antagonist)